MKRRLLALLVVACASHSANACSIPVFRYALEHWRPDPFMVAVFHRGELTDEQIALLEALDEHGPNGEPTANVMVKAIDVDQETDASLRRLWELQQTDTVPWLAVHAPARSGPPHRIWGGALTEDVVRTLRDSPARQKIANRLIAGDSVVWVLLESGVATADHIAYELLASRLDELQTTLRLPEIEEADFGDLSVVPEALRMSFSVLRVSCNDPQESQFITMLLHAGGGSAADRSESGPVAIPIFGRGRAFDALGGDDLNHQTIEDACRFLTAACQCTVKSQNPGLDLLMAVDWDGRIEPALLEDAEPPPLVGLAGFSPGDDAPQADAVENPADASTASVSTNSPPNTEVDTAGTRNSDGNADTGSNDESVSWNVSHFRDADNSLQRSTLLVLTALAVTVALATLFVYVRSK